MVHRMATTADKIPTPPGDLVNEIPVPAAATNRLDRPVDEVRDHILGPKDAPITLVKYGSKWPGRSEADSGIA